MGVQKKCYYNVFSSFKSPESELLRGPGLTFFTGDEEGTFDGEKKNL